MKDFIKEFGDDQQGKKIPITYNPPSEWGFETNIQHLPVKEPPKPEDDEPVSFATEIKEEDLKEMVTEAVLGMMNSVDSPPESNELLEEQREEIEGIIKEYCNRPGIMSISFREDFEKDTAEVNALIDPTNHNNWIALREELIYKLPYSYKESLHTFASKVWNDHKFV